MVRHTTKGNKKKCAKVKYVKECSLRGGIGGRLKRSRKGRFGIIQPKHMGDPEKSFHKDDNPLTSGGILVLPKGHSRYGKRKRNTKKKKGTKFFYCS